MTRGRRLLTMLALTVGAAATAWALTALGGRGDGPLRSLFARAGAATVGAEQSARRWLRGPGRRAALAELAPLLRDTAALRRPPRLLLGAYDDGLPGSLQGILDLERAVEAPLAIVSLYTAWGDAPEQRFPAALARAVQELGSLPLITWEPWLTTFDGRRHPHLPLPAERDVHGLARVAAGDYDRYIDQWARDAAAHGAPLLVRFAHEMNDAYRYPWGPQHNTKEEFIAAWRHVVTRARAAGATNVLWVWSPHVAYEYWDLYYPGDDVVDWVATGVLNYGPIAQWSQWWSVAEIFGTRYERLAAFGKPVMLAEFGSLAVGGDRADWYRQALTDLPTRYPAVRAVVFFHDAADRTVTYQEVDWSLLRDSAARVAVSDALRTWQAPAPPR